MKLKWNFLIYHGKSEINRCPITSIDMNPFKNILVTYGKDLLIKMWNFDLIPIFKIKKSMVSKTDTRTVYFEKFCSVIGS